MLLLHQRRRIFVPDTLKSHININEGEKKIYGILILLATGTGKVIWYSVKRKIMLGQLESRGNFPHMNPCLGTQYPLKTTWHLRYCRVMHILRQSQSA